MLPPGIYLWETGVEPIVSPVTIEQVAESCSGWAKDINDMGPWGDPVDINGHGVFRKSGQHLDTVVVVVGECSTTMEVARYLADASLIDEWGAVVSVAQRSGRGQMRRPWVSPPGNLYVSVLLPEMPQSGPWESALPQLLSLYCGYVIASAMEVVGGALQIKWPNDLLQKDRKVGGMLIESAGTLNILGFGLNLDYSPPDQQMREDRAVPAAKIEIDSTVTGPLSLWWHLVNRFKNVYEDVLDELDPPEFLSALLDKMAWVGHRVEIRESGDISFYAVVVGVSTDGGLIIRKAEGEAVLYSGSIAPL
ncbi:Biotin/acetyl-CoA-carboxylase ligase [Pseudodesulfovibrio profundus]|uniref:Biotin/acetyl-CoA-carboxylase ligase n=1 Tax=Pseudodesulfovibrio profundus TaxID=57320 RepID=A0A2C8F4R4_9BACT|nr:biotin--[acetyl-CoA-carboxylase] ligase [Pseudodesulfovibrio profundus]SOB57536.1 Biotin/acetyl-CoA-carboxylase ligase [Pseudodesulfovibrio profundus]HBU38097.1 biotin--[acetyl-CoA-carboxylase] ligase [Planctomycetaceae bacterium]|tara:strand:+ start:10575 stop:11495 length:921 start_codon:yes stop_codon:yes gene_type:complete